MQPWRRMKSYHSEVNGWTREHHSEQG
jgi:hypothetical protein